MSHAVFTSTQLQALARFTGDWIDAFFDLDPLTGLVHIGAGPEEWIAEPEALNEFTLVAGAERSVEGQFNPQAMVALIPGAYRVVGTSFFRLRR